ncbi:MAG: endonuclease/exonuclease/phosphatase family protein [Phycisphaerales bacterium]|nr:endonuclease/exonuclease/phosphatase family protein [Phycisphaerales bacterium]
MRHRSLLSFLLTIAAGLALTQAACAQGVRIGTEVVPDKPAGSLRLATYNVLNLFDDLDDPTLSGQFDDWYDQDRVLRAKPESERQAVAENIRRLDADVICLEEIESYDALIAFRDQFLADMGYEYVVSIDVGQERGIENAVMSRFPLSDIKVWPDLDLGGVHPENYGPTGKNWYAGQPITFRRSPLRVTVNVPAERSASGKPYALTLFAVHHKSGRYNDYWRDKESAKIVEFIKQMEAEQPAINVAVLGDFNAQHDENVLQNYFDAGMIDLYGDDKGFPVEPRLTHESDRRIDFILVNRNLANETDFNTRVVLGTPVRAKGADYRNVPAPDGYASDHMPVAVNIETADKPGTPAKPE